METVGVALEKNPKTQAAYRIESVLTIGKRFVNPNGFDKIIYQNISIISFCI